jgi:hypothetical protein
MDTEPKCRILLDEYIHDFVFLHNRILEERIKIFLRPRPFWLPKFMWNKLIEWILVIEEKKEFIK